MTTIQQPLLMWSGDLSCVSTSGSDSFWWGVLGKTGENSTRGGGIGFDSSGNLYGMGQTKDLAGGNLNPYTYEGYVWKIDSSGSHQWHRVLGESGQRNSNYDSTLFFTGEVNSSGDVYASGQIHEYNTGTSDGPNWCITGKWNSSGTLQWQRVLKGNGAGGTGEHSGVLGSGLDSSGNYYIFGDLWVDRDRGLIAKYNSSGTLQWCRLLDGGGSTYTRWEGGCVHSNGDIYVAGITNSHSFGGTSGHCLLAKYNSSGTLQWQRYLRDSNGTSGSRFYNMDVDSGGNVYCVSTTLGISKWDSSGNLLWQRKVGTSGAHGGFWNCCVDACGNVYGLDFREDLIDGDSSNDLLIAKLDTNGNLEWTRAFGNDTESDFNTWGDIIINDEHTICICASTQSVYTGTSSTNALMIKLPNDGSLTGNYGDLKYASVSMNTITPSHNASNASLSDGSSGATSVNSSYPESASDNNYTKVTIMEYNTPNVNITTDIASTYSTTAGSGQNFVVAASDNANSSGSTITYQWKYSTNSGSTWTDIAAGEGGTSATLTRYATSYYSDNSHQIKCAITATNLIGSNTKDSAVCTLTVARSWVESSEQTGSKTNWSMTGLKPSAEYADEMWSSWQDVGTAGQEVTWVNAQTNSFNAGARGNECNGGWQMKLEVRINESVTSGQNPIVHYSNQILSSGGGGSGGAQTYGFSWFGGNWDFNSRGNPNIGLWVMDNGTACSNGQENIFAEQFGQCDLSWKYKYKVYQNETRP